MFCMPVSVAEASAGFMWSSSLQPDAISRGSRTDLDCSLLKIYVLGFAFFDRLVRQMQVGCQRLLDNAALIVSPSPDPRVHYHFLVAIGTSPSVSEKEESVPGLPTRDLLAWEPRIKLRDGGFLVSFIRRRVPYGPPVPSAAPCSTRFLERVSTADFLETFLSTSPCRTTVLSRARWPCHECLYCALPILIATDRRLVLDSCLAHGGLPVVNEKVCPLPALYIYTGPETGLVSVCS